MLGVGSSVFYDKPSRATVILHPHRLAASQPSAVRPYSPVGFRPGLVEEDFGFGWCGMGEFVHLWHPKPQDAAI